MEIVKTIPEWLIGIRIDGHDYFSIREVDMNTLMIVLAVSIVDPA